MGCSMSCMSSEILEGKNTLPMRWKRHSTEKLSEMKLSINEEAVDISHFILFEKVIGLGGFGIVRAVKKISGNDENQFYALKSLNKAAVLQRQSGPTAVYTELRALTLLKNCNFICNMHYAFQDDNFLYMIMDLATGGDMRHNLKISYNNRFNEQTAKFFFCQIALALDSCHEASILHRDVKPENIVMLDNGYIKLTDFGVAKILANIEDCRSTSGTHGYMAPEVYIGQHIHGTAADWFSLGVTLYEFLIGRRPYDTKQLMACRDNRNPSYLHDITMYPIDKISYISESCKEFLYNILEIRCHRRLGSRFGIKEIKRQKWLSSFDWNSLNQLNYQSPYIPDLSKERLDLRGDDVKKSIKNHMKTSYLTAEEQAIFRRYEYNNQINLNENLTKRSHDNKLSFSQMSGKEIVNQSNKRIKADLIYVSPQEYPESDNDEYLYMNLQVDTRKNPTEKPFIEIITSPRSNISESKYYDDDDITKWNRHLKSSTSVLNSTSDFKRLYSEGSNQNMKD